MIAAIFAFFVGVCGLQFFTALPDIGHFIVICASPFLCAVFLCFNILPNKWRFIPKFICFLFLGFSWAFYYAHNLASFSLPQNLEGQKIIIEGSVASLPKTIKAPNSKFPIESRSLDPQTSSLSISTFEFDAETIAGAPQHAKLHLSWYEDGLAPRFRDKWRLCVKLKRPHGMLNLGGFDFEQYLWQHGIRATGYVFKCQDNHLLQDSSTSSFVSRLRQKLKDAMSQALSNQPLTGMIIALVLGDQSGIDKEQWQIFRDTGTSYLMAIAGLHISLFAGLMFLMAQFTWRRISRLVLKLPAKQAAAVLALFAGVVYSAVSGFSIPTQRALVMLATFMLALLLRRNTKPLQALFLALLMVLLFDPLAVLSVGFWLSFSAVIFIFYVSGARLSLNNGWLRKYWKMQWAITLGLMPLTLLFFQQVSFSTMLANLIALPGVCSVVVPLSLLGSFCLLGSQKLGGAVLWFAEKLLELVWWWLKWLADFSLLNWHHAIFHWWILATALVGIFLLLAPRGFPARAVGVVWLLPLVFYTPTAPRFGEVWFDLLDVGQGLAATVRTQHHTLVYDTGPKFGEMDAGEAIVAPFLRASGVGSIDAMVVSHGDADHFGGAFSLLKALPVKDVVTSVPEKFTGVAVARHCYAGETWQWDGVSFAFLHPAVGGEEGRKDESSKASGNENSCVLRIVDGRNSILLTGDIELGAEQAMLSRVEKGAENLRTTILVAPHHGSSTGALPAFVAAVAPRYVLFPVGYLNRFHFPAQEVVDLYRNLGAITLSTAVSGAISFRFGVTGGESQTLVPQLYRVMHKRYWE